MTLTLAPVISRGVHAYWIVPGRPEHALALGPHLRPEDRAEVESSGHSVRRSLWRGYRNSVLCETAFVDGRIAAMWGLGTVGGASLLGDLGRPWLLTSAEIEKIPISFAHESKRIVGRMLALTPRLENYCAASYTRAVRFLRLIGFAVDPPITAKNGSTFRRFHMGF